MEAITPRTAAEYSDVAVTELIGAGPAGAELVEASKGFGQVVAAPVRAA